MGIRRLQGRKASIGSATAAARPGRPAQSTSTSGPISIPLLIPCGDLDSAEAFAQERLDWARETGAEAPYASAQLMLGDVAIARGNVLAAEAAMRLALAAPAVPPLVELHAKHRLHNLCLERGLMEEAAQLLPAVDSRGHRMGNVCAGRHAFALGDMETAAERFALASAMYDEIGAQTPATRLFTEHFALALAATGRRDEALAHLYAYLEGAEQFGAAHVLGIAHRALGRVLPGAEGLEHLQRGHELLEATPFRMEAAVARRFLGERLRRDNQRAAARDIMLPALEFAEAQRATPLATRLRDELNAAGSRPRTAIRTGVDALTPSEARIAHLAAEGMTNKQMAQHLFLTVKTIDTHLTAAFRKLDINSRRDLPRVLGLRGG